MIQRTKLCDRRLPDYTEKEEQLNTVSHIAGAIFGAAALILCLLQSIHLHSVWAIVGSTVYGASLIWLYTMSSVYHGLREEHPKKVMQVLDHCTIYALIAGTYTPILLCAIREVSPAAAWSLFGAVWGCAALATVFTAIDLKRYAKFSMACYIGMGWCIVFAAKEAFASIAPAGLLLLLGGGIAYTLGAVLYAVGKKHRYFHSIFHLFVLVGSILQFFCVLLYVLR